MKTFRGTTSSSADGVKPSPSPGLNPGWLLIILAGVLAFWGCLKADFYMDDFGFILNFNGDAPASRRFIFPGGPYITGTPGPDTVPVHIFQTIPTAFYLLTERLHPDVAEASWLYHLWNLLL